MRLNYRSTFGFTKAVQKADRAPWLPKRLIVCISNEEGVGSYQAGY
jgi:hypothetical protein